MLAQAGLGAEAGVFTAISILIYLFAAIPLFGLILFGLVVALVRCWNRFIESRSDQGEI